MRTRRRCRFAWPLGLALLGAVPAAAAANIQTEVSYTADLLAVLDGGVQQGGVFTGLGALSLSGQAGAWALGGNLLAPAGTSLSTRRLSDLAVVSNIDFDGDPRLQELWLEHTGRAGSLRAGLLALDSEFWGLEHGALLVNSGFGAPPGVSLNLPGPPIFPMAAAGVRLAVANARGGQWRFAAVDGDAGDPLSDNRHGWDVNFGQGTLLVAEYEQAIEQSSATLPDRWRIAVHHHSGDVAEQRGSIGLVAGIERAWSDDFGGFARANLSRRSTSLTPLSIEAGLRARWPQHLAGDFALGLSWTELDRERGAAAGIDDAEREVVLEATWAIPLGLWTIQPDVQYVHRPGGARNAGHAWVAGVRVMWAFETAAGTP